MITKTVQPQIIEQTSLSAESMVAELNEQLRQIRGETTTLNRDLNVKREQISEYETSIAVLQGALATARASYDAVNNSRSSALTIQERFATARQALSEEQRRLQGLRTKKRNELIGGIPVDSEYVILVVDTSGSMRSAWDRVLTEVDSILSIYPKLLGIQVLDASGRYVLSGSKPGTWFEDSAQTRTVIRRNLNNSPSSVSTPVPGIKRAIADFYRPDRKISIYYLGDDFSPESQEGFNTVTGPRREIEVVLDQIDAINPADSDGQRLVTIHAIGFPVLWSTSLGQMPSNPVVTSILHRSRERFATLMREMTSRNGGVFVGINSAAP